MRALLITLLVLPVLLSPAVGLAKDERPKPHTDQMLEEHDVFAKFEAKWKSDDIDHRIQILRWFGMWKHKKVLKELKKIWLKEKDFELKAVAADGLGNQDPFKKDAGKVLVQGLGMYEKLASREDPEGEEALQQVLEAKALVSGIRAVGKLGYKDGWKEMKSFIDHYDDGVAGEMMITCGHLKEYRALKILLEWFNYYPNGYEFSGGSVRVDTGAAGTADQRAAKAKWKAKYGGRKKKARPGAWEKLIQSLEMITGVKFEKPAELKKWMKDNKVLMRKHGA